jgi:DNA-binding transcriptional LysR family regulator
MDSTRGRGEQDASLGRKVADVNQAQAAGPSGVELRHLRYFVALAEAGSFTRAAERMYVAQPTLSQQIRRLEEFVGTQLLHRRPDGVRLTGAGSVFLEASRDVLSAMDHGMNRTRHAAGVGRQRLRVVVPPRLPDTLTVEAAFTLRAAADAADVDLIWMEMTLDPDFSLIRQRRADAGLGWLTMAPEALPASLEVMSLGEFGAEAWVPATHIAARRGTISLAELARMRVIHGPRRAEAATYDEWARVLREVDPRFEFTDPPLRCSLAVVLAFATACDQPAAVLTGPTMLTGETTARPGSGAGVASARRLAGGGDMVQVTLEGWPLTAVAAVAWNGDLPDRLQQILFDTADGMVAGLSPARAVAAAV